MSTVSSHADRIVGSLADDVRRSIETDPFAAIERHFGITIHPLDEPDRRAEGGTCDGFSMTKAGTIYYRPTGNERESFTVTHELGHFLVENDDEALDWLIAQPNTRRSIELMCDAIAGRLLISDEALRAPAGRVPTGEAVAQIVATTNASGPACAIRVAETLPCDGFIAIVDPRRGTIVFSSRHGDPRPYAWQGDPLPAGHAIGYLDPGRSRVCESWWPWHDGAHEHYYLNAHHDGWRVYAVFAEHDLWDLDVLHVQPTRREDERPTLTHRCQCGFDGTFRGYPCSECRSPRCPRCQQCACDRRAAREIRCGQCGLNKARHLIDAAGICVDCQ